jgi:hypothetical protein
VSGGTLGDDFRAFNETVVSISGGTTGDVFMLGNSVANVTDGNVGYLRVFSGTANVSGSMFGGMGNDDGVLNFSGGTVGGVRIEGASPMSPAARAI